MAARDEYRSLLAMVPSWYLFSTESQMPPQLALMTGRIKETVYL
jgi:hypothetical protein